MEDFQAKPVELEEKRKEACAELSRAQHGVVATRLASPTDQEMDIDEPDAEVQEADAALARARIESGAKRRKTNSSECDASARAQDDLDKAKDDAGRPVLGGDQDVGGSATQSAL